MTRGADESPPREIPWRATAGLVVGVTFLRLAYLAWWCPYTLAEDEAFYWLWSRLPEWSYYSKGPGIAWVIGATTRILGDTELGVRAGAAVAGGITACFAGALARDLTGSGRAGLYTALGVVLAPIFQASALLMTIDAPFGACTAAFAFFAWRALVRGSRTFLMLAGAVLALGFVMKYTILLALAGAIGFAFATRGTRPRPGAAWLIAAGLVAGAGLVPVVIWNAHHDWPTVKHLIGHLGLPGGDVPVRQGVGGWRYDPMWTLEFLGLQLLVAGPIGVLGLVEALRRRSGAEPDRLATSFLRWLAFPTLGFYLAVSLATKIQGNWTLGAFVPLVVLAGVRASAAPRSGWVRHLWRAGVVVGIFVALVSARLDWASDALEAFRSTRPGSAMLPARARIPTWRVMGAREAAEQVRERIAASADPGRVVITSHYGLASQLSFYLPGHPLVYCASRHLPGGRATQFDHWEATDLRRIPRGSNAVLVGGTVEEWAAMFGAVEPVGPLRGRPQGDRMVHVGHYFQGVPGAAR